MLFYYPNRPSLLPPDEAFLKHNDTLSKYVGEFKWNGDNTTIDTDDLIFYNRDGGVLSYRPHHELLNEIRKTFPKGCLLNGELMHRHTKNVKDLLILHCIMKWKGKILLGKKWGDSRKILEDANLPQTQGTCLKYDYHLLTAQTHRKNFWGMFQDALNCDNSIEGIVLKDPEGLLKFSVNPLDDVYWMIKIRKPCKKYHY